MGKKNKNQGKTPANNQRKVKLILNMIVKNEEKNLPDCFASYHHLIDAIVISDTGSTDNTIGYIRDYMQKENIPGVVVQHPWTDEFHTNRNWALEAAENYALEQYRKGDDSFFYFIFNDADNRIYAPNGEFGYKLNKQSLTKDCYDVELRSGGSIYPYFWLMKLHIVNKGNGVFEMDPIKRWTWVNRRHEVLTGRKIPEEIKKASLVPLPDEWVYEKAKLDESNGYMSSGRFGARSQNKYTFEGDIYAFLKDLKDNPSDPRACFYASSSMRDAGHPDLATKMYKKTLELNGWSQERYISALYIGNHYLSKYTEVAHMLKTCIPQELDKEKSAAMAKKIDFTIKMSKYDRYADKQIRKAIHYFMLAYNLVPDRYEAPYYLMKIWDGQKQYNLAWNFVRGHIDKYPSRDSLFLDANITNFQFHFQASLMAYYAGDKIAFTRLSKMVIRQTENDENRHIIRLARKNLQEYGTHI